MLRVADRRHRIAGRGGEVRGARPLGRMAHAGHHVQAQEALGIGAAFGDRLAAAQRLDLLIIVDRLDRRTDGVEPAHHHHHLAAARRETLQIRSEEHTSELQSLMRIAYAGFCLKKNIKHSYSSPTSIPTIPSKEKT